MEHLTEQDIGAMICGTLPRNERGRVLRHLLGGCCRFRALPFAELLFSKSLTEPIFPPPRAVEPGYEAAITRAARAVEPLRDRLSGEHAALEEALAEVGGDAERLLRLSEDRLLPLRGTVGLVRALVMASFAARYRDPSAMLRLAFFAVRAADALDTNDYGRTLVADVKAHAWGEYSNALGVNDKHGRAEDALIRAAEFREHGSGDALLAAHLAYRLAVLRGHQRRLDEALALLDGLLERYVELGEKHLVGRTLVDRAIHTYNDGDSKLAAQLLEKALVFLNEQRDPQLAFTARFCFMLFLADSGQATRASRLLLEGGFRKRFAEDPLNLIKVRWAEAKIYAGLGNLDRACQAFAETRRAFEERGMLYDAALVGLELAEVWVRQGKYAPVGALAAEMVQTFTRLGISREAVKAAEYLHHAWEQEELHLEVVADVRKFLARLEWRPGLEFKAA